MPGWGFHNHPFHRLSRAEREFGSLPKRGLLPSSGTAFAKPLAPTPGSLNSRFGPGTDLLFFSDKSTLTSSTRELSFAQPQPGKQTTDGEESDRNVSEQLRQAQESTMSYEHNALSSPPGKPDFSRCAPAAGKRQERNSALRVCENFLDAVGMTPLIYLRRASLETHCDIFAKCEFLNPGGSVKDRPAKYILQQAEKEGETATQSTETQCDTQGEDMLKVCGALVVEVPFHKVWHPDHFVAFSGRLASVLNACWGNQFDNLANQLSHYETTGPEIWDQMDGRIDGFVSAAGTGGTVSGVSLYLRSQHPGIQIGLADIPGSALYRYYTEGVLRAEGSSVVENIGQGRITGQLQGFRPDVAFEIPDAESLAWTHSLLEDEGLAVGLSSGVNVAAAIRLAKRLGPGHRIVTLLCDSGTRYAKKQWNISFLKEEGLPYPRMLADQSREMSGIMEAIHSAYAPQHVVEKIEKEHENDISAPGSKLRSVSL
ncbi:Cysteine synthase, related [Neospora caninum Liverpool]|uniref:Cysteine synthase, related n=1 Tax=Neospora caninum (strain Liverpool) TaxID=572307 RepID=F0VRD7_NEOCL|nr:Cysteine synthase, related [Neospora caninum Liverpool]CBZ56285.1 Cysteine synthase, related [Neospora caninum Liverpool]|eukprot:XP_003886310.1 Cysteine synthase, related [Neospora caninum Liverpool]